MFEKPHLTTRRQHLAMLASLGTTPLLIAGCDGGASATALLSWASVHVSSAVSFLFKEVGKGVVVRLAGDYVSRTIFPPAQAATLRDEARKAGVDEKSFIQTAQAIGADQAVNSLHPDGTKIWYQYDRTNLTINRLNVVLTNDSNEYWSGNIILAMEDVATGKRELEWPTDSHTFRPNKDLTFSVGMIEDIPKPGLKRIVVLKAQSNIKVTVNQKNLGNTNNVLVVAAEATTNALG